jgi:single-strand DNA-binding protein
VLNRIILIGRLTRDPEAKYTPSGVPVTSFSIAVDRPQSSEARQQGAEKQTDFIDIVTWRQTAEFAANYLQKGRMVVVEGKLQIRSYVTQEGQQRKAAEVVADNVRALDRPREGGEGGEGGSAAPQAGAGRPASGFGGGSYDRGSAAPSGGARPASGGPPAGGPPSGRPPARPATPASGESFDDFDDLTDPFAE